MKNLLLTFCLLLLSPMYGNNSIKNEPSDKEQVITKKDASQAVMATTFVVLSIYTSWKLGGFAGDCMREYIFGSKSSQINIKSMDEEEFLRLCRPESVLSPKDFMNRYYSQYIFSMFI